LQDIGRELVEVSYDGGGQQSKQKTQSRKRDHHDAHWPGRLTAARAIRDVRISRRAEQGLSSDFNKSQGRQAEGQRQTEQQEDHAKQQNDPFLCRVHIHTRERSLQQQPFADKAVEGWKPGYRDRAD